MGNMKEETQHGLGFHFTPAQQQRLMALLDQEQLSSSSHLGQFFFGHGGFASKTIAKKQK